MSLCCLCLGEVLPCMHVLLMWHVADCSMCVCVVGKMAQDVRMI